MAPIPKDSILNTGNFEYLRAQARKIGVHESEVDDIVQEALITAFEKKDQCRSGNPRPWLRGILKNKWRNRQRRNRTRRHAHESYRLQPNSATGVRQGRAQLSVESSLANRELEDFAQSLSPRARAVFDAHVVRGRSAKEVAAQLDLDVKLVRRILSQCEGEFRGRFDASWRRERRQRVLLPPVLWTAPGASLTLTLVLPLLCFGMVLDAWKGRRELSLPGHSERGTPPPSLEKTAASAPLESALAPSVSSPALSPPIPVVRPEPVAKASRTSARSGRPEPAMVLIGRARKALVVDRAPARALEILEALERPEAPQLELLVLGLRYSAHCQLGQVKAARQLETSLGGKAGELVCSRHPHGRAQ